MAAGPMNVLISSVDIAVRRSVREQSNSNHRIELGGKWLDHLKKRIKQKIHHRSKLKR